jgi:hypothetical protein
MAQPTAGRAKSCARKLLVLVLVMGLAAHPAAARIMVMNGEVGNSGGGRTLLQTSKVKVRPPSPPPPRPLPPSPPPPTTRTPRTFNVNVATLPAFAVGQCETTWSFGSVAPNAGTGTAWCFGDLEQARNR